MLTCAERLLRRQEFPAYTSVVAGVATALIWIFAAETKPTGYGN
jgi:hypothetical protein